MRALFSEPTVKFCEEATRGIIKRPYYALSNFAFFISAIAIFVKGKGSKLSKIFGTTALLIGFFSLVYDSTYIYLAQLFDISGMLLFVNVLLYLNLKNVFKAKTLLLTQLLLFVLNMILIITFQGHSGNIIFGLYITAVVVSEVYLINSKIHTNLWKWLVPFGIFIISFLIWILDARKIFCSPVGLLNGRAIFHYLNAIVIYQLYKFYDSQKELT
ncbi:MAG: ceramidase domain-containing protein [bacterium]